MDREAIARTVRRRQVQEMLDFEREREQTLLEQIELVIGEAESARVDAVAFERMPAELAQIVRTELNPPVYDPGDEEDGDYFFGLDRDEILDDEPWLLEEEVDSQEEELARLNEELENCRRRVQAFEAYLAALGD